MTDKKQPVTTESQATKTFIMSANGPEMRYINFAQVTSAKVNMRANCDFGDGPYSVGVSYTESVDINAPPFSARYGDQLQMTSKKAAVNTFALLSGLVEIPESGLTDVNGTPLLVVTREGTLSDITDRDGLMKQILK